MISDMDPFAVLSFNHTHILAENKKVTAFQYKELLYIVFTQKTSEPDLASYSYKGTTNVYQCAVMQNKTYHNLFKEGLVLNNHNQTGL